MKTNVIYNKPAQEGLKLLPDNSIDLTVTSPPYDNLRVYNGYSFPFEEIAKELYRVTKIGGVVVWVVGDATINGSETGTSFKQALYFKEIGFNLHDTMIYHRQGKYPMSAHGRYWQDFEYMFILVKGKIKKFNALKTRSLNHNKKVTGTCKQKDGSYKKESGVKLKKKYNEFKDKSNIWYYSVGRGSVSNDLIVHSHGAPFPEKLAKDHILSWSNENDIVLDPFIGSGTTAKAAHLLNRKFIGFEISKEYCELIQKRLNPYINNLFSGLGVVLDYS